MARVLELTPTDAGTPAVYIYTETLADTPREQSREVNRLATKSGADPRAATTGLNPADVSFVGAWNGNDAEVLADRLEALANDGSTERVAVAAFDRDGNSITDPREGKYRFASANTIRPEPSVGFGVRFNIQLISDTT